MQIVLCYLDIYGVTEYNQYILLKQKLRKITASYYHQVISKAPCHESHQLRERLLKLWKMDVDVTTLKLHTRHSRCWHDIGLQGSKLNCNNAEADRSVNDFFVSTLYHPWSMSTPFDRFFLLKYYIARRQLIMANWVLFEYSIWF
jgi:hypothetical protein